MSVYCVQPLRGVKLLYIFPDGHSCWHPVTLFCTFVARWQSGAYFCPPAIKIRPHRTSPLIRVRLTFSPPARGSPIGIA